MGGLLAINNTWMRDRGFINTSEELNTTEAGIYQVSEDVGGPVSNGALISFNTIGFTFQLFSDSISTSFYRRICWFGNWSDWVQI